MSLKNWEEKVLRVDGTAKRVAEIEDEFRQAAGLRRYASGSQRGLRQDFAG